MPDPTEFVSTQVARVIVALKRQILTSTGCTDQELTRFITQHYDGKEEVAPVLNHKAGKANEERWALEQRLGKVSEQVGELQRELAEQKAGREAAERNRATLRATLRAVTTQMVEAWKECADAIRSRDQAVTKITEQQAALGEWHKSGNQFWDMIETVRRERNAFQDQSEERARNVERLEGIQKRQQEIITELRATTKGPARTDAEEPEAVFDLDEAELSLMQRRLDRHSKVIESARTNIAGHEKQIGKLESTTQNISDRNKWLQNEVDRLDQKPQISPDQAFMNRNMIAYMEHLAHYVTDMSSHTPMATRPLTYVEHRNGFDERTAWTPV